MNSFVIFLIALVPGLVLVHQQKRTLQQLSGHELQVQTIKQQGFWEWTEWLGKWICLPSVIAVALMECCGGKASSMPLVLLTFLMAYGHNLILFKSLDGFFNLTKGLSKSAKDVILVPLNRTQTSHADLNFLSRSDVTYNEGIQLYAYEQVIGTLYTIFFVSDRAAWMKAVKKFLVNPATAGVLLFLIILGMERAIHLGIGQQFEELSFVIRRLPSQAFTFVSLVILSGVIYEALSVKENFNMVKKFFGLLSIIAVIKLLWMPEMMSLSADLLTLDHLSAEFDAFGSTLCSTSSLLFIKDKYSKLIYAAAFIVMLGYYAIFESAGMLLGMVL